MPIKLANNASGTLAATISTTDTGLTLTAGDGLEFPTLATGEHFYATLVSSGGTQEIVKATARNGDAFTVIRAQEGTLAASFAAGSRFEMRVTAQGVLDAIGDVVATQVGFTPTSGISSTDVQAAFVELDSKKIGFTRLDDSDGAALIGFLHAGTNAQSRTVQSKLRDVVSVKDFGAAGNNLTDDTASINAALTAYPNGTIYFPPGAYVISSPLRVRNQILMGDSPSTAIIVTSATFTGDAVICAFNRDDGNQNVFDKMTVRDLQIYCTKAVSGIDMTGTRNASLDNLYLAGPGVTSVGSIAIRISDNNKTLTSVKSTFFFSIRDINAAGTGWETFIYYDQRHQNCGNGLITNVNSYSKFGVAFGPNNGSAGLVFMRCYLFGASLAGGQNITGTIPPSCFFIDLQSDLFVTETTPINWSDTFSAAMITNVKGEKPIVRGTTASPQPHTVGFNPSLENGAFILSIAAGNTLTAGVNNRFGVFTNSPQSATPEILLDLQPISGLPLRPIQMSGFYDYTALGRPIYIDIVTSATITLSNNLLILVKLIYTQGTTLAVYNPPA